jgi:hypothetical protein
LIQQRISSIGDLQSALAAALKAAAQLKRQGRLPPELEPLAMVAPADDQAAVVSLRHVHNDRQIKSTSNVRSWQPGPSGVWIEYADAPASNAESAARASEAASGRLERLVLELDRAESDPRRSFVAWKWFRDKYLPSRGLTAAEADIQADLDSLVRGGWIVADRVPNPTNPAFPTATIRLDRKHPHVRAILDSVGPRARFQPIDLPGEPLSKTVRDERR